MLDSTMFPRFEALPAELRAEIWRHSLSHPMIFAAEEVESKEFKMTPVGSTTLSVGQSCYEARRLFQETHKSITLATERGVEILWINASSILYLGPARSARAVLSRFDTNNRTKLANVAIYWTNFNDVCCCVQWLAENCRMIRNIILHIKLDAQKSLLDDSLPHFQESLSYDRVSLSNGNESDDSILDGPHFRSLLAPFFSHPFPRLHFIQTGI